MKVDEYVKRYTSGERIILKQVFLEIEELIVEILRFNKKEIEMEFQDVLHFFQLWLYWRLRINGEIWKATQKSVNKFIARHDVWKKIYDFVGLKEDVSNFCGNYEKEFKVVKHLEKFGVNKYKAREAYNKIVLNK